MKKNYKLVKLSSKWYNFGIYFLIFTLILSIPGAIYLAYVVIANFQPNLLLTLILLAVIIGGCIFLLQTMGEGQIRDNVFYLKKFRKPEREYTLDQLVKVKIYENRKERYILATFDDGSGPEKYVFSNSKTIFAGEVRNTETVLKEIYHNNLNPQI